MEQDGANVEQGQDELPADAPEQPKPVVDAQEDEVDAAKQYEPDLEIQLDADHDDAPLRMRSIGSLVEHAPVPAYFHSV
ncbi:hypothetical protein GUJ93_ZPchr0003g16609 [Zizania palustris]|uniref:Uncharacterized protein n=1 Tax=Zizania palustris TaxID=103762 RepID=A0A8J5V7U7_ZIZPA|nr:hypothetical protein GUJ93_ZPchr0003g16609 [Zizania palustris]